MSDYQPLQKKDVVLLMEAVEAKIMECNLDVVLVSPPPDRRSTL